MRNLKNKGYGVSAIIKQDRVFFGAETIAAAAITGGFGLLEGAASAQGQSQSTVTGLTLPPEFELDLIDQVDNNLMNIRQDYQKNIEAYNLFDERMKIAQSSADNLIPDDETIARLRDNAIRLQEKIGLETEQMVEGGFLTQDEAQDLQQAKSLIYGEGELQGTAKEAFENQKAQMIADMRRNGASPSIIQQSLRQLENTFKQGTAQGILGLTEQRSILRGRNYQNAGLAMDAVRGNLQAIGQGIQMQSGLAGQRLEGRSLFAQMQERLRNEGLGQFQQLGQYKLSGKTEGMIERGDIGQLGTGNAVKVSENAPQTGAGGKYSEMSNEQLQSEWNKRSARILQGRGEYITNIEVEMKARGLR